MILSGRGKLAAGPIWSRWKVSSCRMVPTQIVELRRLRKDLDAFLCQSRHECLNELVMAKRRSGEGQVRSMEKHRWGGSDFCHVPQAGSSRQLATEEGRPPSGLSARRYLVTDLPPPPTETRRPTPFCFAFFRGSRPRTGTWLRPTSCEIGETWKFGDIFNFFRE